jgi:hypothetical protein
MVILVSPQHRQVGMRRSYSLVILVLVFVFLIGISSVSASQNQIGPGIIWQSYILDKSDITLPEDYTEGIFIDDVIINKSIGGTCPLDW